MLQSGQYGNDPEMDFISDAALSAYSDWSNAFFGIVTKPNTDEAVKAYVSTRSKYYNTLEWYFCKKSSASSPFLNAGAIYAACTCFGQPLVI